MGAEPEGEKQQITLQEFGRGTCKNLPRPGSQSHLWRSI
jgi:hypothetical protein